MCKFVQVIYKPSLNLFLNLHYIPDIQRCYSQYSKYLQDDFAKLDDMVKTIVEKHKSLGLL